VSHPDQCTLCRHAQWRGKVVAACQRLEHSDLKPDTAGVIAGLLFQNAARDPCPQQDEIEVGPDAYISEDL